MRKPLFFALLLTLIAYVWYYFTVRKPEPPSQPIVFSVTNQLPLREWQATGELVDGVFEPGEKALIWEPDSTFWMFAMRGYPVLLDSCLTWRQDTVWNGNAWAYACHWTDSNKIELTRPDGGLIRATRNTGFRLYESGPKVAQLARTYRWLWGRWKMEATEHPAFKLPSYCDSLVAGTVLWFTEPEDLAVYPATSDSACMEIQFELFHYDGHVQLNYLEYDMWVTIPMEFRHSSQLTLISTPYIFTTHPDSADPTHSKMDFYRDTLRYTFSRYTP